MVSLLFGSHRYASTFITAGVSRPILGADFLRAHDLLVDIRRNRLVDVSSFTSISGIRTSGVAPHISAATSETNNFAALLASRPSLTEPTFDTPKVKHGVSHFIETSGPPIHSPVRRLSPSKLAAAKEKFSRMEAMGIVRRSNSPWASPLHVVEKPGGGLRPCGDYWRLNDVTIPDRYPVPHIQDFSTRLVGNNIFPKSTW
ncbi:Uncharacterized protein FKW44_015987 [Caligus rogercresseyi]|uniref:Uncharacterized protein n=1 Tax=Caligus rogercresseyi TaxID=217165 RepID=A0A7T8H171_CALRO|nr:Uncharacterized protein FKW44_015987 [Caligus rogercresseyi]